MKTIQGIEKPLAEWTLKDVKEMCEKREIIRNKHSCDNCLLRNFCIDSPLNWDLEEKPKFTEQEIEDAKALNHVLLGGLFSIGRNRTGDSVTASFDCSSSGCSYASLSKESFQSIEPGNSYKLYEIIGEPNA